MCEMCIRDSFPPSPQVLQAVRGEVEKLNLYPDPECAALRRALARQYGVERENVFVANGSDEVLNFSFLAFCDKENGVAFPDISYGFYPVFAQLYQIPAKVIPLRPDFRLAPEDYRNLGCTIVFANPNAPTGLALSAAQVESLSLIHILSGTASSAPARTIGWCRRGT